MSGPIRPTMSVMKEGHFEPQNPFEQDFVLLKRCGWDYSHWTMDGEIVLSFQRGPFSPANSRYIRIPSPCWWERLIGRTWPEKVKRCYGKFIRDTAAMVRADMAAEYALVEKLTESEKHG